MMPPLDELQVDDRDDAMALGMRLAQASVPAFVAMGRLLTPDQRVDFVRAMFCTLAGMAEQSIGHEACREVLAFVSTLPPAGGRVVQ